MSELSSQAIEITPRIAWAEHVHGNSKAAAILATVEAEKLDTQDFTNFEVARLWGEFSRIAAVAALSVVQRANPLQVTEILQFLTLALEVANTSYPLATTEGTAVRRGSYWEGVYGEQESTQLICLRDLVKLSMVLEVLYPGSEMSSFSSGMQGVAAKLIETNSERFALIYKIEYADYATAYRSYKEFLEFYSAQKVPVIQAVDVVSRFLGRTVDAHDVPVIKDVLIVLSRIWNENSSARINITEELTRNFSQKAKWWSIKTKLKMVRGKVKQNENLLRLVEELISTQYVGVGQGEAIKIK